MTENEEATEPEVNGVELSEFGKGVQEKAQALNQQNAVSFEALLNAGATLPDALVVSAKIDALISTLPPDHQAVIQLRFEETMATVLRDAHSQVNKAKFMQGGVRDLSALRQMHEFRKGPQG